MNVDNPEFIAQVIGIQKRLFADSLKLHAKLSINELNSGMLPSERSKTCAKLCIAACALEFFLYG